MRQIGEFDGHLDHESTAARDRDLESDLDIVDGAPWPRACRSADEHGLLTRIRQRHFLLSNSRRWPSA